MGVFLFCVAEDPFFFCLSIFLPRGGCRIYQTEGGGVHPEPQSRPMWQWGANSGGGGRRSKHWAPGAGDPRYATAYITDISWNDTIPHCDMTRLWITVYTESYRAPEGSCEIHIHVQVYYHKSPWIGRPLV